MKNYLVFLYSFLVSVSFAQKASEVQVIDESAKRKLNETLKSFVDSGDIAGVEALVFEEGKEVYFNSFGYRDREAKLPMDRSTLVQIYSMTKPVTGTALMILYDEGKFQLDDPLAKYAPEFANLMVYAGMGADGKPILEKPRRPVTIRDVTRHTAGFASSTDIPELKALWDKADAMNKENTLDEMAAKMGTVPLWFHPEDQWSYGPSVDVQAFLVERISGMKFDKFVKKRILDPLKMDHTGYYVAKSDRKNLAASYSRSSEGVLSRRPDSIAWDFNTNHWNLTPGGWGLVSSIDDYMKFAQMLVHGGKLGSVRILKEETVKLMATNHLDEEIEKRSWLPSKGQVGFGIDFAVRLRPPATVEENYGVVGEFFWDGAASTLFFVDPTNDLTAVIFVQLFPFDRIGLHKGFRDAIYSSYMKDHPVVVSQE